MRIEGGEIVGSFKGKYEIRGYTPYTFITLAELSYTTDKGIVHTVPVGFVTDGASIPKAFWSWIGSPFTGLYRKPSLIHDYLYATQTTERIYADRIFLEGMKSEGVSWWKRRVMYSAVRIFAGGIWKRHGLKIL